MELSDALKRFRKTYNITQKTAAEIAGITERHYQRYEYNTAFPNITVLIALANHYNISIDYLIGRSNNPNKPEDMDLATQEIPEILTINRMIKNMTPQERAKAVRVLMASFDNFEWDN